MKRLLGAIIAIFIGIPVVAILVGLALPRDHVVIMRISFSSPPKRVWSLISDFANTPSWRTDVTGVRIDNPSNPLRFTESSTQGDVPFEVVSQEPPKRQVVRVIDDEQPFGGTWMWELEPEGAGSRMTITEEGFIKNPLFRTMGVIFFRPTDTKRSYMEALAKALGENAQPGEIKR